MWLKYPNPILPNVLAADVLKRKVTTDGRLVSHRMLSTEWLASQWIMKVCKKGTDSIKYKSYQDILVIATSYDS